MQDSNQYDELLVRYLLNDLNSAEELLVTTWIESGKENREYFEKLKNTWGLTVLKNEHGKIDVDHEWSIFKRSVDRQAGNEPVVYDEPVLERKSSRAKVVTIIISTAVAASLLVMIGLNWNWGTKKQDNPAIIVQEDGVKDSSHFLIRHEVNTSGKSRKIVLEDSSVVWLAANSEISFSEPFQDNKRDITLTGEAHFQVFKDVARPFTVISGDISTTALGTRFTVAAYKNSENVNVRLYEGKVVIRPTDNSYSKLKKDVYLLPGQELIYNNHTLAVNVRKFTRYKTAADNSYTDMAIEENPSVPKNEKGTSWYMFNNQSLPEVFKQLEVMYGVEIDYSQKDVQKMYFIGKFYKTDSVDAILRHIGKLNNLIIHREKNKFIIN